MLAYYQSGSNIFTMRTAPTGSSNLVLHLQNMMTLTDSSSSISPYSYNAYESMLSFTASLTASVGAEYRAYITSGTSSIWNGSIQVYTSQSIDKPNYTNQIPLEDAYVSRVSTNEYIILE
jgi:hypothetical protein